VTIDGQVLTLVPGVLIVVGSTTVHISGSTEITGLLLVGATVSVTGTVQSDGSIIASSITVLP
jgi:hypothetical protein